jgi:hypothetical protein
MTVILLKSVLAGLGAAALVALVLGLFLQGAQYRAAMFTAPGEIAPAQPVWHLWLMFCASVVAFAGGFWSQYRKVK